MVFPNPLEQLKTVATRHFDVAKNDVCLRLREKRELLLASGCKSPLLFGNRIISNQLPASLRYKGFQDACARNGSPCSEYYIDAEDLFGKNLGEDVYKALKEMKEDGTLSKITTEYLGVDTSPDEKYFDETPN